MPHQDAMLNRPGADVRRDPEDRPASNVTDIREKNLDKTLADSFPTSDPPSSIPDPAAEDNVPEVTAEEELLQDLAPGSWAAVSMDRRSILSIGRTSDEAAQKAHQRGHSELVLLQVPQDPDAPLQAA